MTARLLALALLLGASGCAADPEPATPPVSTAPPAPEAVLDTTDVPGPEAVRPATRIDTIQVEGISDLIDLRRVDYPEAPLPFSTYIPTDWTDDVLGSGEGTAVRFEMSEAFLSVFVPAHSITEADVADLARAVADSRGGAEPLDSDAPWVRSAFAFGNGDEVGSVRVGEHDGTFFYVVEAFPVEYGDGFAPRARMVLDHLRWADGSGL